MVIFLLIFLSPVFAIETGVNWNPKSCTVTGYDFVGKSYTDGYNIPGESRGDACDARKKVNEPELKRKYDSNHARISTLIDEMLAEEDCRSIHSILNRYKSNLAQHNSLVQQRIQGRFELAERTKHSVEVQRWFALMAAYNNACAGEDSRRHNMMDLQTIDELLTPTEGLPTQVTRDGQEVSDCTDVEASGDDDLKNFTVSVERAEDGKIQFYSNVYGIPDHVKVTTPSGAVIYDTGCVAGGDEKGFLEFSIPPSVKKVVISIVNTCENPQNKGGSVWDLKVRCKSKQIPVGKNCTDRRDELLQKMNLQVETTKEVLNAEVNQLQCLMHLDDYVREYLVGGGFIVQGKPNERNFGCTEAPEACEIKRRMRMAIEQRAVEYSMGLMRNPNAESVQSESRNCGPRPDDKGSVLDVVSWAYCANTPGRINLQ